MCGIAGYYSPKIFPESVLEGMVESLRHRGPDAVGFFSDGPLKVGMRRLSINDLQGGNQPLCSEDGNIVLLYNGEIYNYPALRRDLEARGHVFRTRSDGEVICHLYEEEGERLFERLDAMFAVVLWDRRRRRLVLARDLPGEKPLHYTELPGNGLAFASEVKALLRHPEVDCELDLQALWDFPSFLWVPEPNTAFKRIKALLRGHFLVLDEKGYTITPYANRFGSVLEDTEDETIIRTIRSTVEEAVVSRLLSDVPVGSFLSGGLDSSIVTTIAARELDELSTFTIGFENVSDPYHGRSDESVDAAAYAKKLGTKHHTIRVTAEDFRRDLVEFCAKGDQPFSVSSGLGILAVSRVAKEAGIKVLLTGDGADEAFGGYSWYEHFHAPDATQPVAGDGSVSFQNFGMDLEHRLGVLAGYDAHKRAWAWHYYASEAEKGALYHSDVRAEACDSMRHFQAFNPASTWIPEEYVAQDRAFYFPFEMLRKADRMTMACSVEGRVPFAAPAVQALADKLSYNQLVRGGELKWALRRAFEDMLPYEIVHRKKHGFNVPIDHWLSGDWAYLVDETFSPSSALSQKGLLAPGALTVAKRMLADPVRLNGHTIFSFIVLNIWLEVSDTWKF